MKKLISLLVVLTLTCAFLMSSAFAAEDPQIVVSSVEAVGGEEIKLTVSLVNNPGFTNGKITVTYDESGLEFVRIDTETQDVFNNRIMAMHNGAVMNFVAMADVKVDMELFYIYLKVKDGASGDYRVGLTINLMKNNAEEDVVFTLVEGVVSVKGGAGDVPGTQPGDDPTVPDEDPTVPGEDPTVPGEDPTVPGEDPTVPGEDPTVPGEDPTVPGEDPTVPGEDPTVPGEDPTVPGEDTTVPGDEPTTPGNEQTQQDPPVKGGILVAILVVLVACLGFVLMMIKKRSR